MKDREQYCMLCIIGRIAYSYYTVSKVRIHNEESNISSLRKPYPAHNPGNYKKRGAGKSLAPPGRKQATATDDSDVHISYL